MAMTKLWGVDHASATILERRTPTRHAMSLQGNASVTTTLTDVSAQSAVRGILVNLFVINVLATQLE